MNFSLIASFNYLPLDFSLEILLKTRNKKILPKRTRKTAIETKYGNVKGVKIAIKYNQAIFLSETIHKTTVINKSGKNYHRLWPSKQLHQAKPRTGIQEIPNHRTKMLEKKNTLKSNHKRSNNHVRSGCY